MQPLHTVIEINSRYEIVEIAQLLAEWKYTSKITSASVQIFITGMTNYPCNYKQAVTFLLYFDRHQSKDIFRLRNLAHAYCIDINNHTELVNDISIKLKRRFNERRCKPRENLIPLTPSTLNQLTPISNLNYKSSYTGKIINFFILCVFASLAYYIFYKLPNS